MNIVTLTTIIALIIPSKKVLHMFQQNRYERSRYTMWFKDFIKNNGKEINITLLVILIAYLLGYLLNPFISSLIIILYSFTLIEKELKIEYIKRLVFTNRVKRQVVTMSLIYLILIVTAYNTSFNLMMYLMLFSLILPYFIIYLVSFITDPIEKFFRDQFIIKAQNKLFSNKNLITVGVTGSYGKTSSKNIVHEVLSEDLYTLTTPSSYNTPMGITLTINNELKNTHEAFIVEMGADKVGDIVELSEFVQPKYALITSIGPQHLATFKSLDNIINEKMALVERLPKDGVAILNKDNKYINEYKIKNPVKSISYGIKNQDVDYLAYDIKYSIEGSSFKVKHNDEVYDFKTRLLGEHNVLNILSAIALGRELNIAWDKLILAVSKVKFIEHRLELKKINNRTFIDNAFNSNPEGAAMSLKVLSLMPKNRFIITPGMIDLGVIQEEENHKFGFNMKDKVDYVLLVGRNQSEPIYRGLLDSGFNMDNVVVFDTVKEALSYVYQHSSEKDIILLENDLPDAFNN